MTAPEPTIRAAEPDDARAIIDVRIASWRATYGGYLPENVWDEIDPVTAAERFRERLLDGSVPTLVAEVDGEIRAYSFYGPCRDDDLPEAGEVYALYAHPAYWSSGIGRRLMQATLDELAVRPITLWVLETNERARRFYEIAGFVADGSRQDAELLGDVTMPEIRYRLD